MKNLLALADVARVLELDDEETIERVCTGDGRMYLATSSGSVICMSQDSLNVRRPVCYCVVMFLGTLSSAAAAILHLLTVTTLVAQTRTDVLHCHCGKLPLSETTAVCPRCVCTLLSCHQCMYPRFCPRLPPRMQVLWKLQVCEGAAAPSDNTSPDEPSSHTFAALAYVLELDAVCAALHDGALLLLHGPTGAGSSGSSVEEVGAFEGGIASLEWSPAGDVAAIADAVGRLLLITQVHLMHAFAWKIV